MRLKIRKVCMWIIFVQMFLIATHLKFYQSFTTLNNRSQIRTPARASTVQHLVHVSTKQFSEHKQTKQQGKGEIIEILQQKDETRSNRSLSNSLEPKIPSQIAQRDFHNRNISQKIHVRSRLSAVRKCSDILFPEHLEQTGTDDKWQAVDNTNAFVFSAYYVDKSKTIVIIGAKSQQQQLYFCLLWQIKDGKRYAEQVNAQVKQLPEGRTLRYAAVFFECRVQSYTGELTHVSLVTNSCGLPVNMLRLRSTTKPDHYQYRFTVCLTPLNKNYGRAYELVEWIELNRILGAEKFVVYNYSSADNVLNVIDYYSKKNIVEVVQWKLPFSVQTNNDTKLPEIHYFGQTVALQECIYRNKVQSEFIVNIDLDEFIVPHGENISTWNDMLKELNNESGAFIFLNTFFRKEWESVYVKNKTMIDKYRLVTPQKLYRESYTFPPKRRSKYFARTCEVSQVMIHDVIFLPKKKRAQAVAIETGLLHHYRDWENEMSLPELKVYDDIVPRKYGDSLIKNVEKIWSELANVKMDNVS